MRGFFVFGVGDGPFRNSRGLQRVVVASKSLHDLAQRRPPGARDRVGGVLIRDGRLPHHVLSTNLRDSSRYTRPGHHRDVDQSLREQRAGDPVARFASRSQTRTSCGPGRTSMHALACHLRARLAPHRACSMGAIHLYKSRAAAMPIGRGPSLQGIAACVPGARAASNIAERARHFRNAAQRGLRFEAKSRGVQRHPTSILGLLRRCRSAAATPNRRHQGAATRCFVSVPASTPLEASSHSSLMSL